MIGLLPTSTITAYKLQLTPLPSIQSNHRFLNTPYCFVPCQTHHLDVLNLGKQLIFYDAVHVSPPLITPSFLLPQTADPNNHSLLCTLGTTVPLLTSPIASQLLHCTFVIYESASCYSKLWRTRTVTCLFPIPAQDLNWMDRLMNMFLRRETHTHAHIHTISMSLVSLVFVYFNFSDL